jgi:glycerophosphoryl diester phosphodiesterase
VSGPLVIAHGAANSPEGLAAVAGDADVVEADVRRFGGRLEVRHAKTLGPVPLLWEGRRLLPPGSPRPLLHEILPCVGAGVDLLLDLKGPDPRLGAEVLAATEDWRAERGLLVSARAWRTADRLRGAAGVTVMHSVGGAGCLAALLRRYPPGGLEGVCVHRRLLTPGVIAALRERAPRVWTWPVDDPWTGAALVRWGVTGLISDAPERLRALRRASPAAG